MNGTKIKYLTYGDGLVVLCDNQVELQDQINDLVKYCKENTDTNRKKDKCTDLP